MRSKDAAARYREVLENIEARVQRAYRGRDSTVALIPRLTPSAALNELVAPKARYAPPLWPTIPSSPHFASGLTCCATLE